MILDALARLVMWSLHKVGLRALAYLACLVIVFGDIVAGLNASLPELESLNFYSIVLTALLVSWWLARSQRSGRQAAVILTGLGLALIAIGAGRLGNPFFALDRAFLQYAWIALHWRPGGELPDARLVIQLTGELGLAARTLLESEVNWLMLLLHRMPEQNLMAVTVIWSILLWSAASWAGWAVRRLGKPLLAVLPALVLFTASTSYSRANAFYLFPALFGTLALVAWHNYSEREATWEKRSIGFAEDLRTDTSLWALAFITLVTMPAMLISSFSPQKAIRSTREWLQPENPNAEQVGNALGLEKGGSSAGAGSSPGSLPREHLLGSGPELSKQIVMLMRVAGEPANGEPAAGKSSLPGSQSRYYWRQLTYDRYSGHGWLTSATYNREYRENQPAWSPDPISYRVIDQEVQQVGDAGEQIYQSGILVSANQAFEAQWRSENPQQLDLFSARLRHPARQGQYRVISALPNVGEQQLRQSVQAYPEWVAQTYLQLPEDLPQRVIELANGLTSGATTPYDRVQAIESYLRKIPYSLEVPEPPKEREVVDYYLFELKKGYCDYSATALVVLARAAGIPARLVIGYAQGQYDPQNGVYVVTEADAHSWPEVYFAGVGWVEFEPTAGQPEIVRPANPVEYPAAVQPQAKRVRLPAFADVWQIGAAAAGLVGFILLMAWIWQVTDAWRLSRAPGNSTMLAIYRRMHRSATRLKLDYQPGDTPLEYAGRLSAEMERIAQTEPSEAFSPAPTEILRLGALYARAIYSPHPLGRQEQREAIAIWRGLRGKFWRACWRRRWREVVKGRGRN